MRQKRSLLVALMMAFQLLGGPVARADDLYKEYLRQQFKGWDGMGVSCVGDDFKYVTQICDAVASEGRFLAAVAKIKFIYVGKEEPSQRIQKVGDAGLKNPLTVHIVVRATNGGVAIYGKLWAGNYYRAAVERDTIADLPLARNGALEMWSHDVIGVGPVETLPQL